MEKGVKQESSYLLLVMKRDQTNKINAEGVYRWQPLAWGPGPDGSGIDPRLFREWVQHSHASCACMHQGWSGMEVEWKRIRSDVSGGWKGTSQGAGGREEEGQEGSHTMMYHDITPLLCCYVSEWCSSSSMSRVAGGGQSSGSGGSWGIRVSEVEFLNHCWGMDLSVGEPHVI